MFCPDSPVEIASTFLLDLTPCKKLITLLGSSYKTSLFPLYHINIFLCLAVFSDDRNLQQTRFPEGILSF